MLAAVSPAKDVDGFHAENLGSLVQGAIGLGLNMLSAPFVALVVPKALPLSAS